MKTERGVSMKFNEKQMKLGLNLMNSAEAIPFGFCWYNHDDNDLKYHFSKKDFKKLVAMKKLLDKGYTKFIKSIKGRYDR